jgi:hypothetical protein
MIEHLFSHSRMVRGPALDDRKLHSAKSAHDHKLVLTSQLDSMAYAEMSLTMAVSFLS